MHIHKFPCIFMVVQDKTVKFKIEKDNFEMKEK